MKHEEIKLVYRELTEEMKNHPKYLKALEISKNQTIIDLRDSKKHT